MTQEKKHPLGEDAEEAIAQAFFDYKNTLIEICKPFSDEQLLEFSGAVSTEEIHTAFQSRFLVPRMVAQSEVGMRRSLAKAEQAMNANPDIKIFCVTHEQDMRKCDHE